MAPRFQPTLHRKAVAAAALPEELKGGLQLGMHHGEIFPQGIKYVSDLKDQDKSLNIDEKPKWTSDGMYQHMEINLPSGVSTYGL